MKQTDERDMLNMAEASIHKAKSNITSSKDAYIVEVFKAYGYLKSVVDSIKENNNVEPKVDPKQ